MWVTAAVMRSKWYVVGRQWASTGQPGAHFLSIYDPATDAWATGAAPPAEYVSDYWNGPAAARVFAGGVARLELVGGWRPNNNWRYTP